MVDNNVLIKVVRSRGVIDWPSKVNYMRLHLVELLKGFPGIGLGHITLVERRDLLSTDLYIYDPAIYEETPGTPLMIGEGNSVIGIGRGIYTGLELGDKLDTLVIEPTALVLRVDCRPKETGGAGYYYFFKSKKNYQDEKV